MAKYKVPGSDVLDYDTSSKAVRRQNPDGSFSNIEADGARYVSPFGAPSAGESRFACALNGGVGLVPRAAVTAAAADIPVWTFPSGIRRASFQAHSVADDTSGDSNLLGWWLTWNAGNPVVALNRLSAAMVMSVYVAGATVDADTNSASVFIPADGELYIPDSGVDITDIYLMPVSGAGTLTGNSILTGVLS